MCQAYEGERNFLVNQERRQRERENQETVESMDNEFMVKEFRRRLKDSNFRKQLKDEGYRVIRE